MQYQLPLNLRQRAALRTAISFWEKNEVQDKVTKFFELGGNVSARKAKGEWYKLTNIVIKEWKTDLLPKRLEDELIHIVKMIGETIFNWHQYFKHEYKTKEEALNCIDEINWTPYGTVDVVKTFKSSWLENPNHDITKVYNFACRYAIDDHINDLWHKIPSDIQDPCYENIFKRFDQHILAYWKCCRDDDLSNLMRYFQSVRNVFVRYGTVETFDLLYNRNRSIEENMLRLSVHQGYFILTKYFWGKLTEEERAESVLKCARIVVMCYNYYEYTDDSRKDYKRSQYVEICLFLMNQLSDDHKKAFFNGRLELDRAYEFRACDMDDLDVKDEILKMLLSIWPWQELFMTVLKDILNYQDDDSRMACMFLNLITNKMVEDHTLGYFVETNRYRSLLRQTWLILSTSIKHKILQEDTYYSFIDNLIYIWDVDSLKLILDDPGIATVRDQFIKFGLSTYRLLILNDQFEKLDLFMETFLRSEEQKKDLKKMTDVWDSIIIKKFHLADKYLAWQCSTFEERQSVKNSIGHVQLCETLIIMGTYDLLNKFIDWKFETIEEKRNCKDHFRNDIFSIRWVCGIWKLSKQNIDEARDKSSQFLHWLLDSEEELTLFKKKMLINFEVDELITHYLVALNRIGSIDDFLSWCSLDHKDAEHIKQVVSQN